MDHNRNVVDKSGMYDRRRIDQADEQIRQLHKLEAIGRLAGGIAHDFNNLLTIILGGCDLLLATGELGELSIQLVQQVREAGERAATLTRQLLLFSRKQRFRPTVVNLNHLVSNLATMLGRVLDERISLQTNLLPDLYPTYADANQIEQVIMNLVVNARDAMPKGGVVSIETHNAIVEPNSAEAQAGIPVGAYAALVVRDTGCGMDNNTMKHIFEPFFTTKQPGKGTGLGLASAYGIVKQCNGYISVASKVGVGTRFRIYLPRHEAPTTGQEKQPPRLAGFRGTETILLVEDEAALRNMAANILTSHGFTVLLAGNGDEALTVANNHNGDIHLLLTDVIMPGMTGPQLASALAAHRPATKVLYMSGYADSQLAEHLALAKQQALLDKPFTPETLLSAVRSALERQKEPVI